MEFNQGVKEELPPTSLGPQRLRFLLLQLRRFLPAIGRDIAIIVMAVCLLLILWWVPKETSRLIVRERCQT
jgi:hypothetical protein